MKIRNILINGIKEPIGYLMKEVILSFIIDDKDSNTKSDIEVINNNKVICSLKEITDTSYIKLDLDLITRERYDINIISYNNKEEIKESTYFIVGKNNEDYLGNWIGVEDKFLPTFYLNFNLKKEIKKAFIHLTSLGIYEAFLNHNRIGDEYLTPYLSEYRKEVQLITYELTDQLKKNNLLEIGVAPGWYMGHFGGPGGKEIFGNKMGLYFELHLEYLDNSKEIIVSDENVKVRDSDIIFSDIYDGETIIEKDHNDYQTIILNDIDINIIERVSLPVFIKEELKVKEIIKSKKDEIILDFGQNHSGFLKCNLPPHSHVIIECGEVLQDGYFYNENYRSAKARFEVDTKSGGIFYSHYTFYGYRYLRIQGLDKINKDDFVSCVLYSDLERSGYFECSNPLINRLYLNSLWGLKSNFIDMPTDCPQRDERLGWSGDAQVFCHTANFHMNAKVFYEKYLRDLRIYQLELAGGVPSCIPEIFGNQIFTAVWGDAACIIPNELYLSYGDEDILLRHFDLMKDWVDYLDKLIRKNNKDNYLWNFGFQYGDWLALDGESETSTFGGTDPGFIASVYYYNSLSIVEKACKILKYPELESHYKILKNKIKQDILNNYFKDNYLLIDTQTAHIISLYYGIYLDKETIIKRLRELFKENNYYLKTGFVGTPLLLSTLADNGMMDISIKLLFNEEFPSWLYAVKLGATTIWERWNSLLPDGRVSDTGMNSFNHYSYGSVASFMYEYILGVKRILPGYKRIIIKPTFIKKIGNIKGSYDTKYGLIKIEYDYISSDIVNIKCEIPYDIEASLIINDVTYLLESGKKYQLICKLKKNNIY